MGKHYGIKYRYSNREVNESKIIHLSRARIGRSFALIRKHNFPKAVIPDLSQWKLLRGQEQVEDNFRIITAGMVQARERDRENRKRSMAMRDDKRRLEETRLRERHREERRAENMHTTYIQRYRDRKERAIRNDRRRLEETSLRERHDEERRMEKDTEAAKQLKEDIHYDRLMRQRQEILSKHEIEIRREVERLINLYQVLGVRKGIGRAAAKKS